MTTGPVPRPDGRLRPCGGHTLYKRAPPSVDEYVVVERTKRRLGYGAMLLAGAAIVVAPWVVGDASPMESEVATSGYLFPFLWAGIVWAGAAWLHRRGTRGDDVALVAGWVVAMGVNFGVIGASIVWTQAEAGVQLHAPRLAFNGLIGGGLVNGLLIGSLHLLARERNRAVERDRAALRERTEQLEFLNRLLRHDIRNDVSVIEGYAELLAERDGDGTEPILERTEHIVELTELASEVTGAMENDATEAIDLRALLEEPLRQARSSFPAATVEFEGALPQVRVVGSPILRSAFENLIRNAVQHNDEPEPRVRLSATVDADTVTVRVADDGPGIDESVRSKLFEPGRKARDSSGMGLGLYLVETLVTGVGGEVDVADNDPEGTVFEVRLRRVPGAVGGDAVAATSG